MDFDIYEDIIGENDTSEKPVSQDEVQRWREEVEETKAKLKRLMEVNQNLHKKCSNLETNMSSLIKTCKNEINRKNETIAGLRRELDNIILKRKSTSSNRDMRDLLNELKTILREDQPPKLTIPKHEKAKPKNGAVKVTNFSLNDVYTLKVGNTSFTFVSHSDKERMSKVLTVEQRSTEKKSNESRTCEGKSAEKKRPCAIKFSDKNTAEKKSKENISSIAKRHQSDSRPRRGRAPEERVDQRGQRERNGRNESVPREQTSDRGRSRRDRSRTRSGQSTSNFNKRERTKSEKSDKTKKGQDLKTELSRSVQVELPSSKPKKDCVKYPSPNSKKRNRQSNSNIPEDLFDVETTELEHILEEKKRMLNQLEIEQESLLQEKENKSIVEAGADVGEDSHNGLHDSSGFLAFMTPPSNRQRTESEQSSGDFTSVAGIAAILKGKLVPMDSHVSPRTGMVITPPANKDSQMMPSPSKVLRTRHRSKEIAAEINKEIDSSQLIETLGLAISSTEDEASPVKQPRPRAKHKKRKRTVLGFSEQGFSEQPTAKKTPLQ